jgi:hypothetical protein
MWVIARKISDIVTCPAEKVIAEADVKVEARLNRGRSRATGSTGAGVRELAQLGQV